MEFPKNKLNFYHAIQGKQKINLNFSIQKISDLKIAYANYILIIQHRLTMIHCDFLIEVKNLFLGLRVKLKIHKNIFKLK